MLKNLINNLSKEQLKELKVLIDQKLRLEPKYIDNIKHKIINLRFK